MKKTAITAALSLVLASPAWAQSTRSDLNTGVDATITTNGTKAITGAILNSEIKSLINGMGVLTDTNTWTGTNTFTGSFGASVTGTGGQSSSTLANRATDGGVTFDLVQDLGLVADGYAAADAVISSGSATMTSASRACGAADAGKIVVIAGAGAASAPLHTTVSSCSGASYVLASSASTSVLAGTNAASWAIGTDNSPKLATALTTLGNGSTLGNNVKLTAPAGKMLFDAGVTIRLNGVSIEGANIPQDRTAALGQASNGGSAFLITGAGASPFTVYQGVSFTGITVFYPAQAGVTATPVTYPPLFVDSGTAYLSDFTFDRSNCINCYDFLTQTSYTAWGAVRVLNSNIYAIRRAFTLSNVGEQIYTEGTLYNPSVYHSVSNVGNQYLGKWSMANGSFAYIIGNGTPSVCATTVAQITVGPGTVVVGESKVFDVETGHLNEVQISTGADANQNAQIFYVAPSGLVNNTTWQGVAIANGGFGINPVIPAFDFEGTCGGAVGDFQFVGKAGSADGGWLKIGGTNMSHVTWSPSLSNGFGIGAVSSPVYYADIDNPNVVVSLTGGNVYSYYNTVNFQGVHVVNAKSVAVSGVQFDNFYTPINLTDYASGVVNIVGNTAINTGGAYSVSGSANTNFQILANDWDKINPSLYSNMTLGRLDIIGNGSTASGGVIANNAFGRDVDYYANAPTGWASAFVFQQAYTTEWALLNTSGNVFSLQDYTSGAGHNWLTIQPGGNATIGETNSNILTVNGSVKPTDPATTRANLGALPSASWKDYGIVCDGTTDNTAALNSALASGKIVNLPAGTCYVAGSLSTTTGGSGLVGAGRSATTLLFGSASAAGSGAIKFSAITPTAGGYGAPGQIWGNTLADLAVVYNGTTVGGAAVQLVDATEFVWRNVKTSGGWFIGLDVIGGGTNVFDGHLCRIGSGWSSYQAGSRCERFREQVLAGGTTSFPASNAYLTNLDLCGSAGNVDDMIEIGGADTLLFDKVYACGAVNHAVFFNVDSLTDGAYISNVSFTNSMFDGNPSNAGVDGVYIDATCNTRCTNITINSSFIDNFANRGAYIAGGAKINITGVTFANTYNNAIYIEAITSGTITGNTFEAGGGGVVYVKPQNVSTDGSLTISGNSWAVNTSGENSPGVVLTWPGSAGGTITVTGNSFGRTICPVEMVTTAFPVQVSGNSGLYIPSTPVVQVGQYSANVTLPTANQEAILTGGVTFTTTLPAASASKGIALGILNSSSVSQTTSAWKATGGSTQTSIAAGGYKWLVSDGVDWREHSGPCSAVGPIGYAGGLTATLSSIHSTMIWIAGTLTAVLPSSPTPGQVYTLINRSGSPQATSTNYTKLDGTTSSTVVNNTSLRIQWIGGVWQQM